MHTVSANPEDSMAQAKSTSKVSSTNTPSTGMSGMSEKPEKSAKISPEERSRMVAEAAYYMAQRRGFEGGDPVGDWIEAERQVEETLRKRS